MTERMKDWIGFDNPGEFFGAALSGDRARLQIYCAGRTIARAAGFPGLVDRTFRLKLSQPGRDSTFYCHIVYGRDDLMQGEPTDPERTRKIEAVGLALEAALHAYHAEAVKAPASVSFNVGSIPMTMLRASVAEPKDLRLSHTNDKSPFRIVNKVDVPGGVDVTWDGDPRVREVPGTLRTEREVIPDIVRECDVLRVRWAGDHTTVDDLDAIVDRENVSAVYANQASMSGEMIVTYQFFRDYNRTKMIALDRLAHAVSGRSEGRLRTWGWEKSENPGKPPLTSGESVE